MLEKFLIQEQLGPLKYDAKFAAELCIFTPLIGSDTIGSGIIFCTPQTFMNLSGNAVESIARFYQIKPENILILHDEIELPLGKIALKN
jgi:PTH1 family peptidyl-tRNA hydrolase